MAKKKLRATGLGFDYQLTENKIEALKELIDAYDFIPTSIHFEEHSEETIKAESWDRIFNEMRKDGIPTEQDLKRSYTGDYSDLCDESDYETEYDWLDDKSKNEYLYKSLYNIESGLEDCFWYIAKNNIVDNRNLSIFETYSKKLLRIKSIILHNIDTEYYNTYKSERDLIEKMYDFDGDSDRSTEKEEVKERYLEIKNRIANLDNTENKKTSKKYYDYYEIGALFAQGFIYKKGDDFYFKQKSFNNQSQLAKHIQIKVLKNKKSVRPYINQTLNDGTPIQKDFYNNPILIKNVIQYCKDKSIPIAKHYQTIFDNLE